MLIFHRILLLISLLLLISCTSTYSQIMLCQAGGNSVYLVNYKTKQNVKIDLPSDKMVGYKLKSDTLIIFMSNGYGRVASYTYNHEWLNQIIPYQEHSDSLYSDGCIKGESIDFKNYTLHEDCDDVDNFYYKVKVREIKPGLKLTVGICGGLKVFKDGKYLWSYSYNSAVSGLGCHFTSNTAASVSFADDKILFVRERDTMFKPTTYTVMELGIETGKPTKIAKSRNFIEASYSADRSHIFYSEIKGGYEYVYRYDRAAKKSELFKIDDGKYSYAVKRMYWLN